MKLNVRVFYLGMYLSDSSDNANYMINYYFV